jgi:maleylpyruvate isomerase
VTAMALDPAEVPAYLDSVDTSQRALVAGLAELSDAAARGPSLLPGWSRGHVLTHIARNGETLAAMMAGAVRGEVVPQYGGSKERRDADIATGADRPAADLVADVAETSAGFRAAAERMTPEAWGATLHWLAARRPATFALESRWREVEIHRVDLDLGYLPADWPTAFVAANLPRERERLPRRAPGVGIPAGLDEAAELAWLLGRPTRPGLPELPPWG